MDVNGKLVGFFVDFRILFWTGGGMSKKDREFRRILPTDFYFPIAYKFDRDG